MQAGQALGQRLGDHAAVAVGRVGLEAQERGPRRRRQLPRERVEVRLCVEVDAVLLDALRDLAVLEVPADVRWRAEPAAVLVGDAPLAECRAQPRLRQPRPPRLRPVADVDQPLDAGRLELGDQLRQQQPFVADRPELRCRQRTCPGRDRGARRGRVRRCVPCRRRRARSRRSSKFSAMRSGSADLGKTTLPSCRCQRRITWPTVRSWASASSFEHRVLEHLAALPERRPRLGDDAALGVLGAQLGLLQVGVQLDLVDDGRHAGLVDDPVEMVGLEVRDADRDEPVGLLELDERLPGVDVACPATGTGQWIRYRSTWSSPRRSKLASKAALASSKPWSELKHLVVT